MVLVEYIWINVKENRERDFCVRFGFVLRLDLPFFIVSCVANIFAFLEVQQNTHTENICFTLYIHTLHTYLHDHRHYASSSYIVHTDTHDLNINISKTREIRNIKHGFHWNQAVVLYFIFTHAVSRDRGLIEVGRGVSCLWYSKIPVEGKSPIGRLFLIFYLYTLSTTATYTLVVW